MIAKRYTAALLCIGIALLVGLFVWTLGHRQRPTGAVQIGSPPHTLNTGTWLHPPKPLPIFSLKKTDGTVLTPLGFKGHWTLVFFGFTRCPDVCPTALGHMAQVVQILRPQFPQIRGLFISIDPEQDTPEAIEKFVHKFDPQWMGATGDVAELNRLSQHVGVLFFKNAPDPKHPDHYVMDHSGHIVLVNPEGAWEAAFSPPHQPAGIADDIRQVITAYGRR